MTIKSLLFSGKDVSNYLKDVPVRKESNWSRPAQKLAGQAGMAAGYIVTGLAACPAILASWFYRQLNPECSPTQTLTLSTYDIPHLVATKGKRAYPIYSHGFFGNAKGVKVFAEVTGTFVNSAIAALTYTTVGLLQLGLLLCASPLLFMVGAAALLAAGVYMIAGCYQKGLQQQCIETVDMLKQYV